MLGMSCASQCLGVVWWGNELYILFLGEAVIPESVCMKPKLQNNWGLFRLASLLLDRSLAQMRIGSLLFIVRNYSCRYPMPHRPAETG